MVSTGRCVPSAVDDAVGLRSGDGVGDHLDVVAAERGEVVVGDEDALATDRVVGRELGPQLGVGHLLGEEVEPGVVCHLVGLAAVAHGQEPQLEGEVDLGAHDALPEREPAEQHLGAVAEHLVGLGHQPVGRALELVELTGLLGDRRHELHRAGTVADDGDPLAAEVVVVVPPRRVEDGAPERVEPLEVGPVGAVELPEAEHHHVEDVPLAVDGDEVPAGLVVVPLGAGDLDAEPQVGLEAVGADAVAEVVEDLRLLGELAGPVGAPLEGVRVEVRRHVAAGAGVGVVAPHPADLGGLLEHRERLDALLLQADGHADPRRTRPR